MKCPEIKTIIDYIDGELTVNKATKTEHHLKDCKYCNKQFKRLKTIAASHSSGDFEDDKFVDEVIYKVKNPQQIPVYIKPAFLFPAVSVVLIMVIISFSSVDTNTNDNNLIDSNKSLSELQIRGQKSQLDSDLEKKLGVDIFVHSDSENRKRIKNRDVADIKSGYSFTVFNRTFASSYVMIFAVDSKNVVHWFYPAFNKPLENPSSILLDKKQQIIDLPYGVTPNAPFEGVFTFVSLFSSNSLKVKEIEGKIKKQNLNDFLKDLSNLKIIVKTEVITLKNGF